MSTPYYLGIDWGGTRIKLGAVTGEAEFLDQEIFESPQNADIDGVVDGLLDWTDSFVKQIGFPPLGIGLGLTGPVDPELGVVLLPGKVKGLEKYPIVPRFKERFGLPTRAQNDGVLSIYAEKYAGQAKNVCWAVSVTIGTGVGSGVMLDGKILDDPHFMFGSQLSHLVLDASNDQLCLTGARGTGEMLCSATALVLAVRSGLQRGIPSTLTEPYFADPQSIDFRMIIEDGVAKQDRLCCDELSRWTRKVGWLLVNAVHAYSPEMIVLSGGATLASNYFLADVQEHVNTHIFRYPPGQGVPIVVSEIAEHAGVLGAAMMMKVYLGNL
ncbi:Beta-glucoside kinase [Planctomycetes bacterium CA13]|uniref:Beta-glucoside kinase n=1 Tax=Novipirellula herctigrandis TaxID=2527986 RepID=A0A5C5ZAU4_9BACT|nr:Beta-glucoside kinase [Planctomycetes bacterium CA13]